jgi:ParB-like chromosome segregation protein Spo0J
MEAQSVSQAASLGSEPDSLFDQPAGAPSPLAAPEAGLSRSEPPGPRLPTGRVRPVPTRSVEVGERMRPVDPETVEAIAESIEAVGLLHPIGVKPAPEGGADSYRLIYGLHRLEAMARCAERGVPDAEFVLAVIYPPDMADDDCRAAEVIENLMRRELSPEQEAAHRAWLVAYRAKEIDAARERRGNGTGETFGKSLPENGRPAKRGRPEQAASQVARELGLSKEAVNQSVTRAAKITGRARRDFDEATPEEKMAIAREAVSLARPKEKTPGARRPPKPRGADAEPSEWRQERAPPAPSPEPEPVTAQPVDAPGEDATPAPAPEPVQDETSGGITLTEGASPRRLEEAWAAASEGDRAGFVLAHEAEIRRIIAAHTRQVREAVLSHPDLEGEAFYYQNIPDLPTAQQAAILRDMARRLGIEPRPPCVEASTPAH